MKDIYSNRIQNTCDSLNNINDSQEGVKSPMIPVFAYILVFKNTFKNIIIKGFYTLKNI